MRLAILSGVGMVEVVVVVVVVEEDLNLNIFGVLLGLYWVVEGWERFWRVVV
jgi:uncharacterized membrane protein